MALVRFYKDNEIFLLREILCDIFIFSKKRKIFSKNVVSKTIDYLQYISKKRSENVVVEWCKVVR